MFINMDLSVSNRVVQVEDLSFVNRKVGICLLIWTFRFTTGATGDDRTPTRIVSMVHPSIGLRSP